MKNLKIETTNSKALKAGTWYIICTFLTKGIGYLTTPIFSRLLTTEEYGIASTYLSWWGIFTVLATLDLYSCIQIAKIDFNKEANKFLSSILTLSNIGIIVFYALTKCISIFFPAIFVLPNRLLDFMFFEIIFRNAFTLLQTQHRAYLRYKEFVLLSSISTLLSPMISIVLILTMDDNRYWGKIIGNAVPMIVIGFFLIINIYRRGKVLYNKEFWKYGIKISIPLIPHHLAGDILTHFDRVIIGLYWDSKGTALYSLASTYALIAQVFWTSFNNAWVPWFYEKMSINTNESYNEIKRYVKPYLLAFSTIALGIVAVAPEAIKIFGTRDYYGSEAVVPPIVMGVFFQFVYSLYANIEFYYKKTQKLAKGTVIAAIINIILNFMFIPRWGYVSAAYTTLVSYFVLMIIHYIMANRIDNRDLYGREFIIAITVIMALLIIIFKLLYSLFIIRYILIFLLIFGIVIVFRKEIKTWKKK